MYKKRFSVSIFEAENLFYYHIGIKQKQARR